MEDIEEIKKKLKDKGILQQRRIDASQKSMENRESLEERVKRIRDLQA